MHGQQGAAGRRRYSRTTVQIQNLPSHQTTSSLYGAFRIYGELVRIARIDGSSALLSYKADRDALEMRQCEDQVQVDGLPLMVSFAESAIDEEVAAIVSANPTKDHWKCWLCGTMTPNTTPTCSGTSCDIEKGLGKKQLDATLGFEFGNGVTPGVVAGDARTTIVATDIPKLPKDNEEGAVRAVFGRYGTVTNVWVSQSSRGTEAHVTYEEEVSADMAVEYEHSRQLDPHQIVVWKATTSYVVEVNPLVTPWPRGRAAVEAALKTLVKEEYRPKYGAITGVRVRPDLAVVEFASFTSVLKFLAGEGETTVDGVVCHTALSRWSKWPCLNCGYPQNQPKHMRCVGCNCGKVCFRLVNLPTLWPQMELLRMQAQQQMGGEHEGRGSRTREGKMSKREREREQRERERAEARERDSAPNDGVAGGIGGDDDDPMIIPIGGNRRDRRDKQQRAQKEPAAAPLLPSGLMQNPQRDSTGRGAMLPLSSAAADYGRGVGGILGGLPPSSLPPHPTTLLNPSIAEAKPMPGGFGLSPPLGAGHPPLSPAVNMGMAKDTAPYIDSALLLSTLGANSRARSAEADAPLASLAGLGSHGDHGVAAALGPLSDLLGGGGGPPVDPFRTSAPTTHMHLNNSHDLESAPQPDDDLSNALDSLLDEVNFNGHDEPDTAQPTMANTDVFIGGGSSNVGIMGGSISPKAAAKAPPPRASYDPWANDPWGKGTVDLSGDNRFDGNLVDKTHSAGRNSGFGDMRGTDSDDDGLIAMLRDYNNALVG